MEPAHGTTKSTTPSSIRISRFEHIMELAPPTNPVKRKPEDAGLDTDKDDVKKDKKLTPTNEQDKVETESNKGPTPRSEHG